MKVYGGIKIVLMVCTEVNNVFQIHCCLHFKYSQGKIIKKIIVLK